jgi:hypothetical protein
MRPAIIALGVCAALASAPALAQSTEPPAGQEPSGTQLTLEGLGKLMLGLQRMVEELPRYNLPEINENGDIILRRIDPHDQPVQPMPPMSPPAEPGKGVDL